ncbi:MAG: hypothetical protein RL698_2538 [Pseudomonadota bacterium]|jgi:hypothetical protein
MEGVKVAGRRTAKVVPALGWVLAWLVLALAPGCYWQRYPRLVETHLGLMVDYAAKLQGFAEDRVTVPAERWGEFTYPLERARDFARIVASRYPGRRSLAAFDRAVAAYAALVADPAILVRADAVAEIARGRATLEEAAAATRHEIDAER